MKLLILFCSIPVAMLVFHLATKKYLNPYKLTFIFGKKGSGKTTLLTKFYLEYSKKGWNIYANYYLPGAYRIEHTDVGKVFIPPNSLIILDEVGTFWHKRNFKTFPAEVRNYFKYQRHYRHRVILCSQTFDVDAGLRELADEMYLVVAKARVWSYAKKIVKKIVLVEASAEGESRISENLAFDSLLFCFMGSRKLTYIPRYVPYFTSFNPPPLPEHDFERYPLMDKDTKAEKIFFVLLNYLTVCGMFLSNKYAALKSLFGKRGDTDN